MATRAVPPIFVVGNPRSGTKLLREMLFASGEIWMSDIESHFIPKFTRRIRSYGDLADRRNFDRLADAMRRTRAFFRWKHKGVEIGNDAWWDACPTHDWPGVIEGLLHCVQRQETPDLRKPWAETLWGDKTPAYMTDLPLLAGLFPQARFMHIVRDPRDCVLSSEQAWKVSPQRTAQQWADRLRVSRRDGAALGPDRYIEVRFEDLLDDPKRHLRPVFDFLGLPTPPDAGKLARVPETWGGAKGSQVVIPSNKQKWKTRMDPEIRRQIEEITGDLLDEFRYEREHPGLPTRSLSRVRSLTYRVRDALQQVKVRRQEFGSWFEAVRFLMAR